MNNTPAGEPAKSETARILLVEDDDGVALLLQTMLSRWRYGAFTIRRSASLAAALREVAQGGIDLVLLDLGLPDSQGFETFVSMHAAVPRLPIIVLTGWDDEQLATDTVHQGAQDYIVKGKTDAASLARAIRYAIERCRAQQALAEEHDLLRSVMDSIPDQVYLKDINSRFVSVNPEMVRFFGAASCDEIVGKCDFDFLPHELAVQFLAEEQALLHHDQPCVNREAAVTDFAGNTRWMLTTKVLLRDRHGSVTGLLGINRDITERKCAHDLLRQAHEELLATQMQLIQAAKMQLVGQLAAGVAHEVKNPLAIALMGLEYLSRTVAAGDEHVGMVVRDTMDAILQADSVVRGLLDFSAPTTLDLKPQDLNAIVEHSLHVVRHEAQKWRVTSQMDLGPDLPHLPLDRSKIEQTLVNLCMNAIQAMPSGGILRVRTRARLLDAGVTEAIADVEDSGPGIRDEDLARIFDPFFTKRQQGKGTGLGLTVAKRIVELHGGTIGISNRPEGGARVTVTLRTGGG